MWTLFLSAAAWASPCKVGHVERCLAIAAEELQSGRTDRALDALRVACDDDDPLACQEAGLLAARLDAPDAAFLLHAACSQGSAAGCRAASIRRIDDGLPDQAGAFAALGCEAGDTTSCALAGVLAEDHPAAASYLTRACPAAGPVDAVGALACEALAGRLAHAGHHGEVPPLLERACAAGRASACDGWALADPEAATRAWETACAGGASPSCTSAGQAAWERGEVDRAAAHWGRACALGDARGCAALAAMTTTSDPRAAVGLRKQACTLGDARSCAISGLALLREDPEAASALLRSGCAGGDPDACLATGSQLAAVITSDLEQACAGGGARHCAAAAAAAAASDPTSAARWWRAACDGGDPTSCVAASKALLTSDPHAAFEAAQRVCDALAPTDACAAKQRAAAALGDRAAAEWLTTTCREGVLEACLGVLGALPGDERDELSRALCARGYAPACKPR